MKFFIKKCKKIMIKVTMDNDILNEIIKIERNK